jgi:hypothetical protein
MKTVFNSGRPNISGADKSVGILRYLPERRRPYLPHNFYRKNVPEADMDRMWLTSRFKEGPGSKWSGVTAKALQGAHTLHGDKADFIPRTELERFMPDISIGQKAFVTPVTLMSARAGHRVTHDLLHSYDPHVGADGKKRFVRHSDVSVTDEKRQGLHGDTFGCRSAIFRWMRRGPFAQEFNHARRIFRSSPQRPNKSKETYLVAKVTRLARQGKIKAACEQYRRFEHRPPLAVYRALLRACVAQGLIADAFAIYFEGQKLQHITSDPVCYDALIRACIAADNVTKLMWVHDLIRGDFTTNTILRITVNPAQARHLHGTILSFLVDRGYEVEARTVYRYMKRAELLDIDLHIAAGKAMSKTMKAGGVANVPSSFNQLRIAKETRRLLAPLAVVWHRRLTLPHESNAVADAIAAGTTKVALFKQAYADVDLDFVIRFARFEGKTDLLRSKKLAMHFINRCLACLDLLSDRKRRVDTPLPYLLKSKPAAASGPMVRIASNPQAARVPGRLTATDAGSAFWYSPQGTRLVEETYPTLNVDSNVRKYLVRNPVQREVPVAIADLKAKLPELTKQTRSPRLVHGSVNSRAAAMAPLTSTTGSGAAAPTTDGRVSSEGMKFD